MNEEVKPDIIKRTQDLLGKYIKKPPLTEKLLKKPPFRFLHDIITSVINGTGFLDGILTSAEMNPQNIKDKESKIAFLQKIIDAVKQATGIPLTVRPNKIVAGHEPTKTNEFLQAIGKGIESQKGANATTSTQVTKKGTVAKTSSSNQISKQGSTSKDKSLATTSKQTKPHQRNLSQDKLKTKDGDKKKLPTAANKANTNSRESFPQSKNKNEVSNSTKQTAMQPVLPDVLGAKLDLAIDAEVEQNFGEPVDESIDAVQATDAEVLLTQEVEVTRPPSAHFRQRNLTVLRNSDVADQNGDGEPTITQPIPINQKEDITRVQNLGDDSDSRGESIPPRRPMTTRPPSARPASARPAAPRIRDRGEVSRAEEIRPVSRQVNVITENDTINDKDADEFVIKTKPIAREDQLVPEASLQPAEEGRHGHLVDQILETQKDLGDSGVHSTTPNKEPHIKKTDIEWEGGRKRDRETVKQEVAKLRELVQKTARIVNPAGKRMEFVQEDVDTMNRDLETWTETIKQLSLQLQEEQRLTDQAVEPMKMQQTQLEEMILEKRAQISALKSTVLQNDKRIKRLLLGEMVSN